MDMFGDGGKTLYLPPGHYRITRTLIMGCKNATEPGGPYKVKQCLVGGSIIGHGAATTVVWDGPRNGTMLLDSGATGFRFVGVHWAGASTAWYGVAHQSIKMFETECAHEAEAFSGFLWAGIAIDRYQLAAPNHVDGATAETYFSNCLFEDSAMGVLWNNFNALDNHFDGCLWRNCLFGLHGTKGTAYVTNSRFENSSAADVYHNCAGWNHETFRNVVSVGSNQLLRSTTATSLYDVHMYGWRGDHNAGLFFTEEMMGTRQPCVCKHEVHGQCLDHTGDCDDPWYDSGAAMEVIAQLQVHDSSFELAECLYDNNVSVTLAAGNGHFDNSTGVICCVMDAWDFNTHSNSDPVLISTSTLGPPAPGYPAPQWTCKHKIPTNGYDTNHTQNGTEMLIYLGQPISGEPPLGPNVTELQLPPSQCQPTGIDGSTAFLKGTWPAPTKVFDVSEFGPFPSTNHSLEATEAVQIRGAGYWVAWGDKLATIVPWHPRQKGNGTEPSDGVLAVEAGAQVRLEQLSVRLLYSNASLPKVTIAGSRASQGPCTNVTVYRLELGGYGSSQHNGTSGLTVSGLSECDGVDVVHMDGDIHALDNAGLVLTGFHTAGQVTLEGESPGLFLQRVRFACCTADFTTKIVGAQTYACAAFYQESGPNIFQLTAPPGLAGGAGAAAGAVAVNAIKLSATDWLNSDFEGWRGDFFQTGGWATTQVSHGHPGNMTVRAVSSDANLTYMMAYPWDLEYTFQLGPESRLTQIATMRHDDTG
eukprot:gene4646-847_t